jgi:hypothetical protein
VDRPPLVVFYNRLYPAMAMPSALDCQGACEFTADRQRLADAAAIVFHIPTLRGLRLPAKRQGQRWVAWSLESDVNYPELADPAFMSQFEITMTYRRDATIWCPYIEPDLAALLAPPQPKTEPSPVAYFRSSEIDNCGRSHYAAALMRRIKVDSYGKILHNRDLPGPDTGRDTLIPTTARYKFALVLENSIAEDYVSDKFYDALVAGAVPVYRGAPNVAALAPAERSFINTADFAGPAELAAYLNWLNEHDEAYEEYLAWKRTGLSASYRALVDAVRDRPFCRLCAHLRRIAPDDRGADVP